jgi:hypothetical protein
MKTGYLHLKDLCEIREEFTSRTPQVNPIGQRALYIIGALRAMGIEPVIDMYDANYGEFAEDKPKYVNIYAYFNFNKEKTIGYLAHHDIANPNSDNCQDNTASVANLLGLCEKLVKMETANRNVVIGFVDAEEIVSPPKAGSRKLGDKVTEGIFGTVDYLVNLELTANGKNVWCASYKHEVKTPLLAHLKDKIADITEVRCPYNDAFVLAMYGHDSLCIGTVDDANLNQLKTRGFCGTWSLCHSTKDTFADNANEADMTAFVDTLESLI